MTFQVPIFLGFGFCPPQTMEKTGESHLFRYRYVPPRLLRENDHVTNAAINFAADHGALGVDLRQEEIPVDLEPAAMLTSAGLSYWNSLPLYGELRVEHAMAYWKQFWNGKDCFELRSNGPEAMLFQALKMEPQNLWAQTCLEGYHDLLEPHPKHGPIAMLMEGQVEAKPAARPSFRDLKKGVKPEPEVLLRHESEKVGLPNGLYKAVVVGVDDDQVEHYKATTEAPHSIKEGTIGILRLGEESFQWKPYHLLRYEASCTHVPSLVEWIRREGIAWKGPGAVLAIEPVFARLTPVVEFHNSPETSGWRAAIVSSMSLAELDPTWFAWIEDDVRKQMM